MGRTGSYRRVEPCIWRYVGIDGKPGDYRVQVQARGRRATETARTLEEARDTRDRLRQKLKSPGYDPSAGRRSVADAITRHQRGDRFKALTDKDQRQRAKALGWWEERIGPLPMSDLTPPVVADLRDDLLEEMAPATVCRYLSYLSVACVDAVERGWIAANPVTGIRRPRVDQELGEILTDDEVRRLLAACEVSRDRRLRYLVPCLLSCGARISEYLTTRVTDCDPVRGVSLIRQGKTGHRIVRYHGRGLEALRGALEVPSITGLLWADRSGQIMEPRRAMESALKAAGISHPGMWHLLRRTSATWLACLGASDGEIREHLGHAPGSPATARYVMLGQVTRSELASQFVRRIQRAA